MHPANKAVFLESALSASAVNATMMTGDLNGDAGGVVASAVELEEVEPGVVARLFSGVRADAAAAAEAASRPAWIELPTELGLSVENTPIF